MNIVSFFIPFLFTVYTRLQNKKAIAHYLFTFPLAWTIVTCFEPNFEIFRMFLSFIYFYSIYEFGYLQNDCETIKKELEPSMRVTYDDLFFYEKYKIMIYMFRSCVVILLAIYMHISGIKLSIILFPLFIFPVFYIYNSIRSKLNLYIHLILAILKHATIVFIILNEFQWSAILWLFLYHPFCFFIELSVRGKAGYKNLLFKKYFIPIYDKYHVHKFRVCYQFFFLFISLSLVAVGGFPAFYLIGNLVYTTLMIMTFILFGEHDEKL